MVSEDRQVLMFNSEFQPGFVLMLMSVVYTANEGYSPPKLTCHPPRGFLVGSKKGKLFIFLYIYYFKENKGINRNRLYLCALALEGDGV